MADLRSQLRVTVPSGEGAEVVRLAEEVNAILGRLQQGGLLLAGLKLTVRDAVPVDVPGPGTANLVMVDVAGVHKFYVYDLATGWVAVGTQV